MPLFITLDDNKAYLASVVESIADRPYLKAFPESLQGPSLSQKDPESNYSTAPLTLGHRFDFIFIDGRRRMECAFMALLMSHEDTIVVLHDYRRGRYAPITALFDIVEDGVQFRVMRARRELLAACKDQLPRICEAMRQLQTRQS